MLTAYLESAYVELQLLIEVGREHVELRARWEERGGSKLRKPSAGTVEVGAGRT
jgi:hypothetical protein